MAPIRRLPEAAENEQGGGWPPGVAAKHGAHPDRLPPHKPPVAVCTAAGSVPLQLRVLVLHTRIASFAVIPMTRDLPSEVY